MAESWAKGHDVCCAGGCGAVLENADGTVGRAIHHRVEEVTDDGIPILLLYCEECASDHDRRTP